MALGSGRSVSGRSGSHRLTDTARLTTVLGVDGRGHEDDDLLAREAELSRRAAEAAAAPPDAVGQAELADERDALANAWDERADERDVAAQARRTAALARDVAASDLDRRARARTDDTGPAAADRFLSWRDVDAAAGDRSNSLSDEWHAAADRERSRQARVRAADDRKAAAHAATAAEDRERAGQQALTTRTVIGQAQGLLMATLGIGPNEAFALLAAESQARNIKLRDVAAEHVRRHIASTSG